MRAPIAGSKQYDRGESRIQRLKRRGVLAATWAAVAGLVAKQTTQPVFAGTDGDVVLGAPNASTATTSISYMGSGVAKAALVYENATPFGAGLWAEGSEAGVVGNQVGDMVGQPGSAGVWGMAEAANSPGVLGQHDLGIGVIGQSQSADFGGLAVE